MHLRGHLIGQGVTPGKVLLDLLLFGPYDAGTPKLPEVEGGPYLARALRSAHWPGSTIGQDVVIPGTILR